MLRTSSPVSIFLILCLCSRLSSGIRTPPKAGLKNEKQTYNPPADDGSSIPPPTYDQATRTDNTDHDDATGRGSSDKDHDDDDLCVHIKFAHLLRQRPLDAVAKQHISGVLLQQFPCLLRTDFNAIMLRHSFSYDLIQRQAGCTVDAVICDGIDRRGRTSEALLSSSCSHDPDFSKVIHWLVTNYPRTAPFGVYEDYRIDYDALTEVMHHVPTSTMAIVRAAKKKPRDFFEAIIRCVGTHEPGVYSDGPLPHVFVPHKGDGSDFVTPEGFDIPEYAKVRICDHIRYVIQLELQKNPMQFFCEQTCSSMTVTLSQRKHLHGCNCDAIQPYIVKYKHAGCSNDTSPKLHFTFAEKIAHWFNSRQTDVSAFSASAVMDSPAITDELELQKNTLLNKAFYSGTVGVDIVQMFLEAALACGSMRQWMDGGTIGWMMFFITVATSLYRYFLDTMHSIFWIFLIAAIRIVTFWIANSAYTGRVATMPATMLLSYLISIALTTTFMLTNFSFEYVLGSIIVLCASSLIFIYAFSSNNRDQNTLSYWATGRMSLDYYMLVMGYAQVFADSTLSFSRVINNPEAQYTLRRFNLVGVWFINSVFPTDHVVMNGEIYMATLASWLIVRLLPRLMSAGSVFMIPKNKRLAASVQLKLAVTAMVIDQLAPLRIFYDWYNVRYKHDTKHSCARLMMVLPFYLICSCDLDDPTTYVFVILACIGWACTDATTYNQLHVERAEFHPEGGIVLTERDQREAQAFTLSFSIQNRTAHACYMSPRSLLTARHVVHNEQHELMSAPFNCRINGVSNRVKRITTIAMQNMPGDFVDGVVMLTLESAIPDPPTGQLKIPAVINIKETKIVFMVTRKGCLKQGSGLQVEPTTGTSTVNIPMDRGDSGAPIFTTYNDGSLVLIGLVSYGADSGDNGLVSLTRAYKTWDDKVFDLHYKSAPDMSAVGNISRSALGGYLDWEDFEISLTVAKPTVVETEHTDELCDNDTPDTTKLAYDLPDDDGSPIAITAAMNDFMTKTAPLVVKSAFNKLTREYSTRAWGDIEREMFNDITALTNDRVFSYRFANIVANTICSYIRNVAITQNVDAMIPLGEIKKGIRTSISDGMAELDITEQQWRDLVKAAQPFKYQDIGPNKRGPKKNPPQADKREAVAGDTA